MRAKSSGCLWDGFIGSFTATLQIKVTEMLEEIIYIFGSNFKTRKKLSILIKIVFYYKTS